MLEVLNMDQSKDSLGLRLVGPILPDASNSSTKIRTVHEDGRLTDTPIVSPDRIKLVGSYPIFLENKTEADFFAQAENAVVKDVVELEKVSRLDDPKNVTRVVPQLDGLVPSSHDTSVFNHEHHEDDSSHDDSSYFNDPSNLPEPKSDRRFSWSSNASASKIMANQLTRSRNKESDASLSLSDDSDAEEVIHHSHSNNEYFRPDELPLYSNLPQFLTSFPEGTSTVKYLSKVRPHTQQPVPFIKSTGMTELYPQQITRMHSVSSLISTSSQASTTSESSVRDELQDVAMGRFSSRKSNIPSGRLSPILGEHPPSRNHDAFVASPSTINFGPSPPQILQLSELPVDTTEYCHPQPHLITSEQLQDWMQTSKSIPFQRSLTSHTSDSVPNPNTHAANSKTLNQSGDSSNINNPPPGEHGILGRRDQELRPDMKNLTSRSQKSITLSRKYERNSSGRHSMSPGFKVYWQRWVMLMYLSFLNLLSDWTCYSVAPIALMTEEAFGDINAEQLVTLFLVANAFASACEPMILARLGLRRTVLFGSLLLMIGSVIKSGGMPPIIQANIQKGTGEWRVYLGFFIVGLSQPLYQCTPALLSASWFPEAERTMATSVALNSNQIGIGFAFIFGTLLVAKSDDIPGYFGLLSILSTLTFLGTLFHFSDAPPTPPSETAKVVRGTLEVNLPTVSSIFETMRNIGQASNSNVASEIDDESEGKSSTRSNSDAIFFVSKSASEGSNDAKPKESGLKLNSENAAFHGLLAAAAPSPAPGSVAVAKTANKYKEIPDVPFTAQPYTNHSAFQSQDEHHVDDDQERTLHQAPFPQYGQHPFYAPQNGYPYPNPNPNSMDSQMMHPHPYNQHQSYTPYVYPYFNPNAQQYPSYYPSQPPFYQQPSYPPGFPPGSMVYAEHNPYSYQHSHQPVLPHMRYYEPPEAVLPPSGPDDGAEPVLTITPHHLDINIRDDQIILSLKACLARPGFIHSLVAFTASGIVINTLSTFMDYLVRLNGAGREYTGIVGGSFQFVIMISSLIVGQLCDRTRAYYSIIIAMLVLGAFGLAQCGVSLDADRGNELRWSLVIVAALVGPLQPVSTELGVDVVYPLSENTVLVIQQLFSNLLSAAFIPCFKAMRDIGTQDDSSILKPQYTFSFYLLIVLHAIATVIFATFNGRYLRFEHEQEKVAEQERRKALRAAKALQRSHNHERSENAPLL